MIEVLGIEGHHLQTTTVPSYSHPLPLRRLVQGNTPEDSRVIQEVNGTIAAGIYTTFTLEEGQRIPLLLPQDKGLGVDLVLDTKTCPQGPFLVVTERIGKEKQDYRDGAYLREIEPGEFVAIGFVTKNEQRDGKANETFHIQSAYTRRKKGEGLDENNQQLPPDDISQTPEEKREPILIS